MGAEFLFHRVGDDHHRRSVRGRGRVQVLGVGGRMDSRVTLIYLSPLSRSGLGYVVRLMLLKGQRDLRGN